MATQKSKTETSTTCRCCGQTLPVKQGKGRAKERCLKCIELESAFAKVEALLGEIVFADEDTVSEWRGRVFMVRNVTLNKKGVKVAACETSPNDCPRQETRYFKPRKKVAA